MAEKHKSKYKSPKDLEKSQKPSTRKDIKDYTHDDKDGTMNPMSTKEKQSNVPRKTDKLVIDDVENMVPKLTDKDRVYKKVEDGDYDPKHAAKYFEKNQKQDTEEYLKKLKTIDHGVTTIELEEKLNKLTPENKLRLVREYIRRKISNIIQEQLDQTDKETTTEPEVTPEIPDTEKETADTPDTETPDMTPDSPESDIVMTPEDKFVKYLQQKETGIEKATAVISALSKSIKDLETDQKLAVYKMLQSYAIKSRNYIGDTK